MNPPRWTLWFPAVAVYAFLYLPIAVVMLYSFNAAKRGGPWRGFSTAAYTTLAHSPEKLAALSNTLILAASSTLISSVLGTLLGYGLSRYQFPAKKLFARLIYLPVVIPDIVAAIALLIFYSFLRDALGLFELGLTTMMLTHITFQIPFVAIVVRSRLADLDPTIEEAAHDLGANPWQKFRHITLPLMWPGILAGAALAFTLSIDDFVVSFFTAGPGSTTLPILIYSSVKRGITPDINALSTLIVLVSILGAIAVALLRRPRDGARLER
jgi:spermidine/putrescine transport system permease protein